MNSSEFVLQVRRARRELDAALVALDRAQMVQPATCGRWSVKDVISHIAWYEREMIVVLGTRALIGSDLWKASLEERNAAIHAANKDLPLDAVLAESARTFLALSALLETLTDEDLLDPARFREMPPDWIPWQVIASNTFEHYADHAAAIRKAFALPPPAGATPDAGGASSSAPGETAPGDVLPARGVTIRSFEAGDQEAVVSLLAAFRTEMASLRGSHQGVDPANAAAELQEYVGRKFPIFVAGREGSGPVGFLICRVEGDTTWADALYVSPSFRHQGIASGLYHAGEQLFRDRGQPTLYNRVQPGNDQMIRFLRARGYDVLNLVEIRRPVPGETFQTDLNIGNHTYRY